MKKYTIGFIGQGWVGRNCADDFENRGYPVVRYALEQPYVENKDRIKECDMVFIAVPTPTVDGKYDDSILRSVVKLVGKGKSVIIKSTVVPGATESIQRENPDIYVFHSPEFLVESTAAYDTAHPNRNLVGIPVVSDAYRTKAQEILDVLPAAPYAKVLPSRDTEFVKYAGNCFLLTKVVFMNILYDLVTRSGGDWESVREAFIHDPRVGASHTNPVHSGGRGAGGDCFIKDFKAFQEVYRREVNDPIGDVVLEAISDKNLQLLVDSGKDIKLVTGVHGKKLNAKSP